MKLGSTRATSGRAAASKAKGKMAEVVSFYTVCGASLTWYVVQVDISD
jgi:hypothetical protein